MARPTKATEATIVKLVQALSIGSTLELACKYAGIASSTLRMWRAAAEQAKPGTPGHQLIERLDAAEGQAAVRWLSQIEQAALNGQWQAAAWKLERRYPSDYGRHIIEHDGHMNLTSQPEWTELRTAIMQALADMPEARLRIAEALSQEHHQEHRNGTSNGAGR